MSSLLIAEKTVVRSVIVEKDALQPVLEGSLRKWCVVSGIQECVVVHRVGIFVPPRQAHTA
jgi:hypothetical protein